VEGGGGGGGALRAISHSLESGYCQKKIKHSLESGFPVLGILLGLPTMGLVGADMHCRPNTVHTYGMYCAVHLHCPLHLTSYGKLMNRRSHTHVHQEQSWFSTTGCASMSLFLFFVFVRLFYLVQKSLQYFCALLAQILRYYKIM
jgi:hypothetical protein